LVWFWKQNPKFNLIQAIFTKVHVNASNNIWFSIIFYFLKKISIIFYCFRSIYDFNLDWFKYEHLIGNFFPGSTFLKKIVHSTIHFKINIQSTLLSFFPLHGAIWDDIILHRSRRHPTIFFFSIFIFFDLIIYTSFVMTPFI